MHKTKNTAILAAALLSAATLSKADTFTSTNNNGAKYYDVHEINKEIIENAKLRKEFEQREKEERFKWENIPDYQKLTTLFYGSLIAIFLMNLLTGKPDDRQKPSDKD